MPNKYKIMVVAGEASGDAHAAEIIKAIQESEPETEFELPEANSM